MRCSHTCFVILWTTGLLTAGSGCQRKVKTVAVSAPPPAAAPAATTTPPPPVHGGVAPNIRQGVSTYMPSVGRVDPSNDLRNIGMYYRTDAELGNPPKRLEDMSDLKRQANNLYQAIQQGYYVICWNARITENAGQTVLGYVHDVPQKGGIVLMLDGSIHNVTAAEFQAAAKAGMP